MKGLVNLMTGRAIKYKTKVWPEKKPPTPIKEIERVYCRIMPQTVVDNLDAFLRLPPTHMPADIKDAAKRTRELILKK